MRGVALATMLSVAVGSAAAGAQTPPDAIFADGFESGDLSAWSLASIDGGDLSAQAAAALASTSFGLQALVNDRTGVYVQDDTPTDEDRYRARFYFDPSRFDPGEAAGSFRTRIFLGFEEGPTRRLFAIVLKRQAGQYSVMGRVRRNDGTQADTGFFPITAGEHWVEVDWVRASSPVASDGTFEMWIDGPSVSALTGLTNGISAVDFVRLGALSVKAGASGILRWDQFASRRQTEIGPSRNGGEPCTAPDQCGSGVCAAGVCKPVCGNGVVEAGETCDPPSSCPACSEAYTCYSAIGSAGTCDLRCHVPVTACGIGGDQCCAFDGSGGCSSGNDPECAGSGWQYVRLSDVDYSHGCATVRVYGFRAGGSYLFTTCRPPGGPLMGTGDPVITSVVDDKGTSYPIGNDDCTDATALPNLVGWDCDSPQGPAIMSCAPASPGGFIPQSGIVYLAVTICAFANYPGTAPFYVWFNAPGIPGTGSTPSPY